MSNCTEENLRVRAYHMFLEGYGKDDKDRYYMASNLCRKMDDEECKELVITPEMHTCMFCDTRYGSIETPYLPKDILVCWWCFLNNSKEELIKQYVKDLVSDSMSYADQTYGPSDTYDDIHITDDDTSITFEADMSDDSVDNVKDTVKDKLIDDNKEIKKYSSGFNRLFGWI